VAPPSFARGSPSADRNSTKPVAGTVLSIQELSSGIGGLLPDGVESSEHRTHVIYPSLHEVVNFWAGSERTETCRQSTRIPSVLHHQCRAACTISSLPPGTFGGHHEGCMCIISRGTNRGGREGTCVASGNLPGL
jgi:hypothetical protein